MKCFVKRRPLSASIEDASLLPAVGLTSGLDSPILAFAMSLYSRGDYREKAGNHAKLRGTVETTALALPTGA